MPATSMTNERSAAQPASSAADGEMRAFGDGRALTHEEMCEANVRWPRPHRLLEPLELAKGKLADAMSTLGLSTVGDLLEHLPRDRREARTVATLAPGEQATVAVQVRAISARPVRRRGMRPLVQATVHDASGSMRATFFNQPWLVERYPPGTQLVLHGKADERGGFRVSHHAIGAQLALAEAPGAATRHASRPRRRGHVRCTSCGRCRRPLRRQRGCQLDADPGARAGAARAPGRRARAASVEHARRRRPARSRERAGGHALRPRAARQRARARATGLRGAAADAAAVPAPPRATRRRADRARARAAAAAERTLARRTACPSRRPAISSARSPRSTRICARRARCSAC